MAADDAELVCARPISAARATLIADAGRQCRIPEKLPYLKLTPSLLTRPRRFGRWPLYAAAQFCRHLPDEAERRDGATFYANAQHASLGFCH